MFQCEFKDIRRSMPWKVALALAPTPTPTRARNRNRFRAQPEPPPEPVPQPVLQPVPLPVPVPVPLPLALTWKGEGWNHARVASSPRDFWSSRADAPAFLARHAAWSAPSRQGRRALYNPNPNPNPYP